MLDNLPHGWRKAKEMNVSEMSQRVFNFLDKGNLLRKLLLTTVCNLHCHFFLNAPLNYLSAGKDSTFIHQIKNCIHQLS